MNTEQPIPAEQKTTAQERSQHTSPHRAARGWEQRRTDRVPRRDEPLSSVQFRQRSFDRETESSDIVLHLTGVSKHAGLRVAG
jgi:hypothetical protein